MLDWEDPEGLVRSGPGLRAAPRWLPSEQNPLKVFILSQSTHGSDSNGINVAAPGAGGRGGLGGFSAAVEAPQ